MGESSSNKLATLCMGALGGLYRPTRHGYNGNLVGCRARLSVSLVAGLSADCWARRLAGPADWSDTEPTSRSRRWRVWLVAVHCSCAANDAGLVSSVWL